jgi:hypothetical protein
VGWVLANYSDLPFFQDESYCGRETTLPITGWRARCDGVPAGWDGIFSLSPTPWQFGQVRQNLVIPETSFWIGLYPLTVWGALRGFRRYFCGSALLLVPAALLAGFYAFSVGNIGTVYRVRIQVWLIVSIFVGWGWEALREKQRRSRCMTIPARGRGAA